MTPDDFIAHFEAGLLAPETFRHKDHLRITWLYLLRHGRAGAEDRLIDGLRAFAIRAGKPGKFDAALTRAWIAVVDEARRTVPASLTFEEFLAARPDLLDPRAPRVED